MNVIKVIRSKEWWEYKLPPLLAMGYATVVISGEKIYAFAGHLAFLLASIIVGAVYVSVVNDMTDMEEDRASGKHNRLSKLHPAVRWLLLTASLALGAFCAWRMRGDMLTLCLYLASYLAFTLYSVPPFRLKKRGFAGVMADASGAHLFPSLLLVAGTSYFLQQQLNWWWFGAVGVWAFMCGLRGILWHQFIDRENDLKIGLATFATKREPSSMKHAAMLILAVELVALGVMLYCIGSIWPLLALAAYSLLLAGYAMKWDMKLIAIVPPADKGWHILMSSYYQGLFPVAILVHASIGYPLNAVVLAVHLLLFPRTVWKLFRDALKISVLLPGRSHPG
ncbi:MAG TPA: UbiA family prenyltransferase [Chitinophagaceae bacterium]|nr:UbiA family prenyltransferase [Chitinophagaceae bacterium]